jgi:tryptophan synthase alpha chain
MNKIDELFRRKDQNVLSVYFTAGYPQIEDTALIIKGLEDSGADLVEIGFPFSDPVADGPVIQASSHRALANGMNLDLLFGQLESVASTSGIPKILMGYYNTVYQYGVSKFLGRCIQSGVSGVIIPDLPPEIYEAEYQTDFEKAGIHFICLVSPHTSPERISYLSKLSRGFLYILSTSGITGQQLSSFSVTPEKAGVSRRQDNLPTLIGFGIHNHDTFEMACEQANGAIIGSEFISQISRLSETASGTDRLKAIGDLCSEFVNRIRG